MNERIRELAAQAEHLADQATNAFNDNTGNWQKVWNDVYDEKFVDLIIQEAAMYVKNSSCFTYASQADLCAQRLKQHFGVE